VTSSGPEPILALLPRREDGEPSWRCVAVYAACERLLLILALPGLAAPANESGLGNGL
jgi:hypothetical protein